MILIFDLDLEHILWRNTYTSYKTFKASWKAVLSLSDNARYSRLILNPVGGWVIFLRGAILRRMERVPLLPRKTGPSSSPSSSCGICSSSLMFCSSKLWLCCHRDTRRHQIWAFSSETKSLSNLARHLSYSSDTLTVTVLNVPMPSRWVKSTVKYKLVELI